MMGIRQDSILFVVSIIEDYWTLGSECACFSLYP